MRQTDLRVAEHPCHRFDRREDIPLRLRAGREVGHLLQRARREDGADPRTKVLGGEVPTRHVAQVIVHVRRVDVLHLAIVVEILKELAAGKLLAAPDDASEPGIAEFDIVILAGLPLETESDRRARHLAWPSRIVVRPYGLIVAGVLVVADTDERLLEQLHDGGDDLGAGKRGAGQVLFGAAAKGGQRGCEIEDAAVLGFVPHLAPARVIAMLLAALDVPPGCLEVAVRVRADPHVLPGRRDDERSNTFKGRLVAQSVTVGCNVAESFSHPHAADTRRAIRHIAKS